MVKRILWSGLYAGLGAAASIDALADKAQATSDRLAGSNGVEDELADDAASVGKLEPRPRAGGPNPFVVLGVAFVAGIALAKLLDWRGHGHPRG
jgi:hypothetical protein